MDWVPYATLRILQIWRRYIHYLAGLSLKPSHFEALFLANGTQLVCANFSTFSGVDLFIFIFLHFIQGKREEGRLVFFAHFRGEYPEAHF